MTRVDGRGPGELRPVRITADWIRNSDGAVLVEWGDTRVLCTANLSDSVPPFAKERGQGWVTAEYGMLPGSTSGRTERERRGPSGRSAEIQRLVGRSLRSVVDLGALAGWSLWIDCDVLQADAGTRCASVTGGWVAAAIACRRARAAGRLKGEALRSGVAAVSVAVHGLDVLLDPTYLEDSRADVDFNVVLSSDSKLVELQGTAEIRPFSREQLSSILDLATGAAAALFAEQKRALDSARP